MNEFTDKNEQAFLDACGAIGAEPNAMVNTQKERYLVSEFLKNPVSWLETEILYHSYTTRGEAQEVANGIDRMISEGAPLAGASCFLDQSYRIQRSGPDSRRIQNIWQSM
jgi:hypothetical protein